MPTKRVVWGVGAIVAVAVTVFVWSANVKPDPNAPPIYQNADEYLKAVKEVRELTKGPFEAMHEGFPINETEIAGLKRADRLIDGMIAFNTQTYSPYILKGLTRRALGDKKGAMRWYEQGLAFAPKEAKGPDVDAIARIYDEIGTLYFEDLKFPESEAYADKAVQMLPTDPSILSNAASTKIQLKRFQEAKDYIERALKIAPGYDRATALKKLLEGSTKKN